MTLQELFTVASDNAADIFRETGQVLPMWHAIDHNDEHMLLATPWDGPEDKRLLVGELRRFFRMKGVKQYVFMSEAWSASTLDALGYVGRMHEHPDRREVLAIHAEDSDGKTLMGWFYILRPEHGPAKLSPLQMSEATESRGQLMGMLR